MRSRNLGVLLGVTLFAACFVDRPSQSYECSSDSDCGSLGDNRVCRSGYCVVPQCPSACATTCDEVAKTCPVECASDDGCGNVTCPAGWHCTINCVGTNACQNINCEDGSRCTITCSGSDACETVSCRDACACDLQCTVGVECNTPTCPMGQAGDRCTADGTNLTACSSSPAGCMDC